MIKNKKNKKNLKLKNKLLLINNDKIPEGITQSTFTRDRIIDKMLT